MGSDIQEVERCVAEWRNKLIDSSYTYHFRNWILKEYPEHLVEVKPLLAWRAPVSNREYREYVRNARTRAPESMKQHQPDQHPVWGVMLEEAIDFACWRAARDGVRWRLPTEAEWEWLAAGPARNRYPFGEHFDAKKCNTIEQGLNRSREPNSSGESWCGLWELGGNVEEWTSDRYVPYPGGTFIEDDLSLLIGHDYPILRGGSFLLGGDLARCARRHGPHPGPRFRVTGFRLVAEIKS